MVRHLKPGQNFGDDPSHFPRDFGFSGSAARTPPAPIALNPPALRPGHKTQTFAKGGAVSADKAQDKRIVTKAINQHDAQLHGGKKTNLKLKSGGKVMKACKGGPVKMAQGGLVEPVNRAPAPPRTTHTVPGNMPGDVLPYGVQPSDEPTRAGSTQGITQLRTGGRVRVR